MNHYLSKIMIYHEAHKLSREGYSLSYISRHLGLNWRTVKRLLSFTDDRDYENQLQLSNEKSKVLDSYTSFVKSKLENHPESSCAQIHDWLKEHYVNFPKVSSKTVFNFVTGIRQKYHLPKTETFRQCSIVEELPYGLQAQVDFGFYNMRDNHGKRVKVSFFTMVLSRSRYKFVFFHQGSFTTELAIEAHEQAFAYMQGIADTLVYDQDRLFMVNENKGDLILTDAFRHYCRQRKFKLHFCRKADPQSKGKIENVVKYVKQNFLYNRPYVDIDQLNTEALAWLGRTANALPHSFTCKKPADEWAIERPMLQPYYPLETPVNKPQPYSVRQDNSFSYKGNFYSLPLGCYQGRGSKVLVEKQQSTLVIFDLAGQELCRHLLCTARGEKVINTDHRRDKSKAIGELEDRFCISLLCPQKGRTLVSAIRQDKPRYVRDQLLMLIQCTENIQQTLTDQVVEFCIQNHICSVTDFRAVMDYFIHMQSDAAQPQSYELIKNPLDGKAQATALLQPNTSSIHDYDQF